MYFPIRNVGDDWSCAPENHLPENNVRIFRRIPEGQPWSCAVLLAISAICLHCRNDLFFNFCTSFACSRSVSATNALYHSFIPFSSPFLLLTATFSWFQLWWIGLSLFSDFRCVAMSLYSLWSCQLCAFMHDPNVLLMSRSRYFISKSS